MLRKPVPYRRTVIAVVLLSVLLATAAAAFAVGVDEATTVPEEQGTPMEFLPPQPHFTAVPAPDGRGCLVVPRFITVFQPSPKEIRIPVVAVNMSPGTGVRLLEITVSDKSGKERAKLAPNAALRSVADVAPTKEKLPLILDEPESPDLVPLLKKSYLNPEVIVPVEDLATGEGGAFTLLTTATFETGKAKHTVTAETLVVITALPSRPNWYLGDGHNHTTWSDGNESIPQRVSKMKNAGFKWIIVTDHEDEIRKNGGWQPYVSDCNSAQSSYGIVVAPGAEIGCVQTQGDPNSTELGHALGYRLKESATSIPQNKYYTPQNLINAINSHNSPYSYAVIAHPYRAVKWQDWSVTGFRAMELLSYERTASSSTISKWVSILKANLPNTIAGKGFVVGVGNSDHHRSWLIDYGRTWIYTTSYSPTNRAAVWDAIKAGRASATGDGNLGLFTINGYMQGSVVRLPAGGSFTFKVVQQPVTGFVCNKFEIINRDGNVVKTVTNPGTETTISWTAPSEDWFYFIRFTFQYPGSYPTEVITNPIFLDVY